MKKISRRIFTKYLTKLASGAIVFGGNTPLLKSGIYKVRSGINLKVFVPMPVQVVIDDVGWWSGEDGNKKQEPYRTGINRNHVPADYQSIVDLGRTLGIRPQAAFILCEWDKENILRQLPTSTWMGEKWDNTKWIGPWMEEAADIIRNSQNYFEFTLHGIGHEYWEGDKFTRAEWTDSNGQMRPRDQVEQHLDFYDKLMKQHNLGPFPKSFVPAAFRHSFGPSEGRDLSLAEIFIKRGIDYINTPFGSMHNRERVQYGLFGLDSGVMTVDRGRDLFSWTAFPGIPSKPIPGPTCGMHWPNMLHPDPERNPEVVKAWADYLKPYNDKPDMMLAPDSDTFQHQLVHHTITQVSVEEDNILLDFTKTDKLQTKIGRGELTIKVLTDKPCKFRSRDTDILSQSAQKGTEFLYKLKLKRKPGMVKVQIRAV